MNEEKHLRGPADDSLDEGSPAWITSYSDMMTDLLAIFVILFSFAMMSSSVAKSKAAAGEQETATVSEQQAVQQTDAGEDSLDGLIQSINSYIGEVGLSGQLSVVKQGEHLLLLRVSDSALFETGQADITPQAERLLGKISEILAEYQASIKMVRIEGHTDNRPINTKRFDSNWELSTSRAVNVLRRLLEVSPLGPEKFSAVGYGEFHPIAKNDTAENMAKNRRVDFIIETVDD